MTPEQRSILRRIADRSLGHSHPLTPEQEAVKKRVEGYALYELCPCFCGHMEGWDYSTKDRHGFRMELRLCTACGLLRTNPRPTAETLARYYESDFRALYGGGMFDVGTLWNAQEDTGNDLCVDPHEPGVFDLGDGATVYDIGCGTGGMLRGFFVAGCNVHGCDLNTEYLGYGRRLFNGDSNAWSLRTGGAETLPDGRADLVIAMHTLEHRPDLREALAEHRAKLKPGGQMLVGVPALATVRTHYGESLQRYLSWAHLWHFTAETLRDALWCSGFSADATWDGMAICDVAPFDKAEAYWRDRDVAVRTMRELMEAQS